MKKLTTMLLLFVALMFSLNDIVKADVYPFHIRVTQPTNETPFDGNFTDGTAAAVRFYTPYSTVTFSATVKIYSGNTLIKTIMKDNLSGTDNYVLWDGSTDASAATPNGQYTVEVTTTQDKAATAYTTYDTGAIAAGLSTRGVTVVNNPLSRNNGFAYGINGGGTAGTPWQPVGLSRVSMSGKLYGDVIDSMHVTTTGLALGGTNRRYSPTYAPDGYIYSVAYTEKKIMRVHPDTLDNEFFTPDTVPTTGTLLDVEVVGEGAGKGMIVTSTTQVLFAQIGDSVTYRGPWQVLLTAQTGMTFWASQAGGHQNQKHLFVVVRSALANIMDGVFKFDYTDSLTARTFADTVWGTHFADGDAVSITMKSGNTAAGDVLYFTLDKAGAGTDVSGVYAITNLDAATPTVAIAFADPDNNTTSSRGEVGVDQGGNLIYFENSNEQIFLIEPPTTNLSYTNPGIDPVTVTNSGIAPLPISISEAKVDANNDFIADKVGQTVIIKGVVITPDLNLSSTSSNSFYVQDETGGLNIYSKPRITPFLAVGDVVQVTGVVTMYNGLTELVVTGADTTILQLGKGTVPTPKVITVEELMANGEEYESTLITINALAKSSTSVAWPAAGSDANMTFWDGNQSFTVRVDKDFDLAGQTEPVYPVNMTGFVTQYSTATPPNNGYQLMPRYYTDIAQNVPVPPLPYFHLATPANNATVEITDSNATYNMTWNKAVDFNNDAIIYQFVLLKSPVVTSSALSDTVYSFTGTKALGWLGTADTLVTKWTVKAKGAEAALVSSVDTFTVTIVRKIPVGINDNIVPVEFYVNQNYPNPFNPSTTISFGLPKESFVDLRVYNVLGQEVAVLISNQMRKAGNQQVRFDASGLASGTYIYRLKTDNQVVTKKMILMK
ncbi:MAG: T9SS type A sorting domain-containing protein [Ignavibacteria bacterium]|nr:T9SS type A sorting domain-containing protein [Ignavibacteria bacterium]